MEETEPILTAQFTTKIVERDLIDFQIYHNYHSIDGILKLLFGITAFIICGVATTMKHVNVIYVAVMGLIGFTLTFCVPVSMVHKIKKQMRSQAVSREPVKYVVTEKLISMFQADIREDLLWNDISKAKFTGRCIILYGTSGTANIIPVKDLGSQAESFFQIAQKSLQPFQMKIDIAKVIRKAKGNEDGKRD